MELELVFFNHMENGTSLVEVFPERRKELLNLSYEERTLLDKFYGAFISDIDHFGHRAHHKMA